MQATKQRRSDMKHIMKLDEENYCAIENGYKTIELRLYDEKRRQISLGDTIEFVCSGNNAKTLTRTVKSLHRFESFDELYRNLPLLKCGYTPFTWQYAKSEDMRRYYTEDQQKRYGVIAIEFEENFLTKFRVGQAGKLPFCSSYETALEEIKNGLKTSHWMWYVFPQLKGLTTDPVTEFYALSDIEQAKQFLCDELLGAHIKEAASLLLQLHKNDPVSVLGLIDAYKLKSSMTLFDAIYKGDVFSDVLDKFCLGQRDCITLTLLVEKNI